MMTYKYSGMNEILLSHEEYYEKIFSSELIFVGVNTKTLATYIEHSETGIYYKVIYLIESDEFKLIEVDINAENF